MTCLYSTLPDDAKRAFDLHEHAAYRYEMAHTEDNHAALLAARDALIRALRSWSVRVAIEADEAA